MNHNLKEKMLGEYHEYSQPDTAKKLFMAVNTVASLEKKGIEKFKIEFAARGYKVKDFLS